MKYQIICLSVYTVGNTIGIVMKRWVTHPLSRLMGNNTRLLIKLSELLQKSKRRLTVKSEGYRVARIDF